MTQPSRGRSLVQVSRFCLLPILITILVTTSDAQHSRTLIQARSNPNGCPKQYWSEDPNVLSCPDTRGLTLLPAHYPPRTLFVGYDPEPRYLSFLNSLIARNAKRKVPLQIVLLIPRLDVGQAYQDLKRYMDRAEAQHLTFFTMPSDETLWTQDYLEIGISMQTGAAKIIDLPYADREGEWIPPALALSCQLELLSKVNHPPQEGFSKRGDYGGNIEALPANVLLIGNSMSPLTRKRLKETLPSMFALEIDVDWLDTGHVDEVFTVIPQTTSPETCPFVLAYASPKLALSIIRQHRFKATRDRLMPAPLSLDGVRPELQDQAFFTICLDAYSQRRSSSRQCQRFIDANLHYDRLIEQDRQRIHQTLLTHKACTPLRWVALPQLFVPSEETWLGNTEWGTPTDLAQAVNPNAVNVIALGEDLIMPHQPYPPFNDEISKRLAPLGLNLMRVDSAYSHFLNGGLHCNTSVARMCRPRPHKKRTQVGNGHLASHPKRPRR